MKLLLLASFGTLALAVLVYRKLAWSRTVPVIEQFRAALLEGEQEAARRRAALSAEEWRES